ncbi:MFS transporter [Streptomyces kanamyceticus]|uniref:MFS transporter n=1 Tax=Streptomyces kanamyceticus TaxID=1967 RepID=A0A5J6GI79_STRKN|nr:MFS transporter [Streptomyces kanamyceticus]QEU95199.1 MFS transporter [Streptomyces kanamyceticus]
MTTTIVRVLRDRNAGLYLGAVVVSGFGTSALWLASGIWVKELTGSDGLAALCQFALWAPTLMGPLLGTLADRTRRRPLLVAANLALAALLLTLVAVDDDAGRLWILFTVLFLYGACGVVTDAAEAALVATAVDKELLGDFNGLRMSANEGMKLVAPLAGAGLFAAYGGAPVALLDAVTFVLAAGMFALLRVREAVPVRELASLRARTAEGARYLWGHERLRPLVVAGGLTMLSSGITGATVYAVVERLGHSPTYTGVLYVVQGAGSVAVGVASGALMRRFGARRFGGAGIALTALSAALTAVPNDAAVLAGSLTNGIGLPCVLIAGLTAVQRETPDALVGRVAATANTLMFTPTAIGIAAGAALVESVDIAILLPVLAGARLLIAAPLLRSWGDEGARERATSRPPSA